MSGVTGEIGYKVGAVGNNIPWQGTRTLTGPMTVNGQLTAIGTQGTGFDLPGLVVCAVNTPTAGLNTPLGTATIMTVNRFVTIQGSATVGLLVDGQHAQGTFCQKINGNTIGGHGLQISAGVANGDKPLEIFNAGGGNLLMQLTADGRGTLGLAANRNVLKWGVDGSVAVTVTSTSTPMSWLNVTTQVAQMSNVALVLGTSTTYAWGTGTSYPILQMAGVGALFGTDTMGVVLTGGGLYYNGTKYIYGQAGTGIVASLGTGSFTISCVSTAGTAAGTATLTTVFSVGGTVTSNAIQGYGPQAAALVDMTPDSVIFTCTVQGVTPSITTLVNARRSGNMVILAIIGTQGTSNANTLSIAPIPAAWQSPIAQIVPCLVENNGVSVQGFAQIQANNGTIIFAAGSVVGTFIQYNQNGFTASGQKGPNFTVIPYTLT